MNFILTLIAIAYICICGYGLIRLILRDNIPFSLFGLIPLSFGAGLGILAVLSNIVMLLGWKISFITIHVPLFFLFAYALSMTKIEKVIDTKHLIQVVKGISWKEWLLIAVVLFGVVSVFFLSCNFPMHFWDSRAIWGAKAKMLFFSGTVHSSEFTDPSRLNAHFRYPLLFPISQAYIYISLGKADDWAVMGLIGLFFPFLVAFLYDITRIILCDRKNALVAAALIAVLPIFFMTDGHAYSGYADTPLSMFYCISFGLTLLSKRSKDTGMLLLAAFLTGLLFLTKNEGANLVLLNIFLLMMPDKLKISMEGTASLIKTLLIFAAVIALVNMPWLILARGLALEPADVNDIFQLNMKNFVNSLNMAPTVLSFSLRAFLGIQKNMLNYGYLWGGLWLIFSATSLIAIWLRFTEAIQLSSVVLLNFIIISAAYTLIPGISDGFMLGNFFRLNLAINSVIVLQIVLTLKALGSKMS